MEKTMLTKLAGCLGCGAKLEAGTLCRLLDFQEKRDENLLVGFETSDDCCVYKISDEVAVIQTLDFFPPVADDPFIYGQIAAANALSDIYAMGADPKLAMNILCVTKELDYECIREILHGGSHKTSEAGAVIAGGHTIVDITPKYGLSVTGFAHPDSIITNAGLKVGDVLFLTKPLGVGILLLAAKGGLLDASSLNKLHKQMMQLNKYAKDIMIKYDVHACTDVTGFGLLGHLYEMAKASGLSINLNYDDIPVLDGALEYATNGILPEGMYNNRRFCADKIKFADRITLAMQDILFDPQTSGGLLFGVSQEHANKLLCELSDLIPNVAIIGQAVAKREYCININ